MVQTSNFNALINMYVCERELVVMRFEKGYENISCLKNTPIQ